MERAIRPQLEQRSVTCERGMGGTWSGSRRIRPEHEGQLRGEPVRSFAMSCNACAGLYVAGRGFRMNPSKVSTSLPSYRRRSNALSLTGGRRRYGRERCRLAEGWALGCWPYL